MTPSTASAGDWQPAGSFVIAHDHPCLAGHFPGNPIVPGVVLLDEAFACLGASLTLVTAKFTAPVRPGETVAVRRRPMATTIEFSGFVAGVAVMRGAARAA